MARFSAEEKALLKRLLDDGEPEQSEKETEQIADQVADAGSEEIIVFRGNAEAFKKAFGLAAPETPKKSEEPAEPEAEPEQKSEPKSEPKAPSRSRYFG
ncbi:hypothetical protein ABT072_08455 [Streptomyces sp. NPDC002589]|uniref:hypothetical protein n=1 Tax=Streptomyces sp. NPDC002589 TaxID=3154420 RepID=UPI003331978D